MVTLGKARFGFVGFGARADADAVCCDGLVPGAGLHLSHWGGNATPRELKADTSVEIALRQAEAGGAKGRVVVNNHFDTDGVLAVWTLLEPERALAARAAIVAAAEVGDFEEWPADPRGVRLDAAITALAAGAEDDEASYTKVLPELGALVANIDVRRDLWGEAEEALARADEQAGTALEVTRHGRIALFRHRGIAELPAPVLSRRLASAVGESARDGSIRRWLVAVEGNDAPAARAAGRVAGGIRVRYRYERPRWAWADTVVRPVIAEPDRKAIARALGPGWTAKASGMTAIAQSEPMVEPPLAVVDRLQAIDRT